MEKVTKTFRAAILGAGHISPFHIAGIRSSPNVELVALCDLDVDRAGTLAQKHGVPHAVDRIEALLELGVDVIHVATPPASHAELTRQALAMGCHVFVEKPLAASVDECEQIARLASEAKRQVAVNHSNLADPFIAKAINYVKAGYVGEVLSACYLRSSNYPDYLGGPLPIHYREGGFPFRDIGVHALYTFRALLGEIQNVNASFAHRGRNANLMFDEWTGTVECERGHGMFQLSWNVRPLQNMLIVQGTRGVIRCEPFSMYVTKRRVGRLPKLAERVLNSMGEAGQIVTQVPLNVVRFAAGRLKQYHGVQETIRQFYRQLPHDVPAGLRVEDAIPIVRWTESVSCRADEEKRRRLARIPAPRSAGVLVTGATGFIGRNLVDRLLETGQRIRLFVRSEPAAELLNDKRIEVVLGDLGDPQAVSRAVAGTRLVFHLGAAMSGSRADFERGTEVGTRNVVDAILQNGNTRLVYVSSLSVLHASRASVGDVITETWPLEPAPESRGNYTLFKLRAEQIVSAAVRDRKLQAIIIRPGQVFGPGVELVTPAVARRMGSRLVVLGDGSVPLPLVYVDDLVDALVAAAQRGPFDGTIIQIVDDQASIDQNELLRRISDPESAKVVRVPLQLVYLLAFGVQTAFRALRRPAPLNTYRVRSALSPLQFDSTQARTVFDWNPRIGVERGLSACLSPQRVDETIADGDNHCEHTHSLLGKSSV